MLLSLDRETEQCDSSQNLDESHDGAMFSVRRYACCVAQDKVMFAVGWLGDDVVR